MEHNLYQKLYFTLIGAMSDAINALENPANVFYARYILIKALQDVEDYYLDATEEEGDYSSPAERI